MPGGSARGANVAFRPSARNGDTEAVRADEPSAVRTNECEQPLLSVASLRTGLGEPGGDHAERRGLRDASAAPAASSDLLARKADDGKVDRVVDLLDRCVRAHAGDRLRLPVDRICGADEVRRQDVAEELAADRAAPRATRPRRRPTTGWKNGPQRVDDRDVVALVDAACVVARRRDREARARSRRRHALRVTSNPASCEDRERRRVRRAGRLRRSVRSRADAQCSASCSSSRRPDAATLLVVGDGERHLGGVGVTDAGVAAESDDPVLAVLAECADERTGALPVRIEKRFDGLPVERPEAVESEKQTSAGKLREEGENPVGVLGRWGLEAKGAAVAENDVDPGRRV